METQLKLTINHRHLPLYRHRCRAPNILPPSPHPLNPGSVGGCSKQKVTVISSQARRHNEAHNERQTRVRWEWPPFTAAVRRGRSERSVFWSRCDAMTEIGLTSCWSSSSSSSQFTFRWIHHLQSIVHVPTTTHWKILRRMDREVPTDRPTDTTKEL